MFFTVERSENIFRHRRHFHCRRQRARSTFRTRLQLFQPETGDKIRLILNCNLISFPPSTYNRDTDFTVDLMISRRQRGVRLKKFQLARPLRRWCRRKLLHFDQPINRHNRIVSLSEAVTDKMNKQHVGLMRKTHIFTF